MRHLTVQQISGSLDGALSGVSLELVVRHLSSCRECRERHARLTKQDDALRRLLACEFAEVHFEDMFARLGVVLESESRGEMTPEHALPPELPPLAPEPSRSRELPRPPSQQLPHPALLSEDEQKRRAAEALKEAEAAAMASLENLFRDLNAQKHAGAAAEAEAPAAPEPLASAAEPEFTPEPTPAPGLEATTAAPASLIALPPDVLASLRAAAPEPPPAPEPVAEEPAALQWTVIEGSLPVGPELPGEIEPHVPRTRQPDRTGEPDPPPTERDATCDAPVPAEPIAVPEPELASETVVTPEPIAVPAEPAAVPEPELASETVVTPEPVAAPAEHEAESPERPRLRLLERARLDSPALPREPEHPEPVRAAEPLTLVPEREPQRDAPRPRAERARVPRRVVISVSAGVAMLAGVIALSLMPPVIRVPVPELPRPRVPRIEVVKVPVGATPAPATPARRTPAPAAARPTVRSAPTATPLAPRTAPPPAREAPTARTPASPPPSRPAPARAETAAPVAAQPRPETPAIARPAAPVAVAPTRPAPAPVAPAVAAPDDEAADDGAQWPLLCGVVVDDAGAPVAGARIALADLDLGARTDRRGHFCLAAPPGDRTLSVLAAGFATHRRIVSLGAQTLELSIALTPAP